MVDELTGRGEEAVLAEFERIAERGGVPGAMDPHGDPILEQREPARSSEEEKRSQLARLRALHERNAAQAPAMLRRLRDTVIADGNVFEALMDAVRVCSLGRIRTALFEVGGQYRRNM